MGKLSVFNFITLNGFYKAPEGDISWHMHGEEENKYSEKSLEEDNILLFGRVTYEMMAGLWPSPDAIKNIPVVAKRMNNAEKIVLSTTLEHISWNNTRIIKQDIIETIKELKKGSTKNITTLGSGSVVTQLAGAGLIDEYQVMIDPVAIGEGTPMFNNMKHKLTLKLSATKIFKSGTILLTYQPL